MSSEDMSLSQKNWERLIAIDTEERALNAKLHDLSAERRKILESVAEGHKKNLVLLEENKKKQIEEDKKRAEEDKKRQEEDKKRQDEEKKREEERKKREADDRKKKDDEDKKKKDDDDRKKKEDDDKKKKDDDDRKKKEDDDKKKKDEDDKNKKDEADRKQKEDEQKKKKEEDLRKAAEDAQKKKKEDEARKAAEDAAKKVTAATTTPATTTPAATTTATPATTPATTTPAAAASADEPSDEEKRKQMEEISKKKELLEKMKNDVKVQKEQRARELEKLKQEKAQLEAAAAQKPPMTNARAAFLAIKNKESAPATTSPTSSPIKANTLRSSATTPAPAGATSTDGAAVPAEGEKKAAFDFNAHKSRSVIVRGSGSANFNREVCDVCGKTVYAIEKVAADGKIFHKTCMKCSHCNKVLKLGNYAALDGKFFCKPHFKQLFMSKGNYNEGFGKGKLTAEWSEKSGKDVSAVIL